MSLGPACRHTHAHISYFPSLFIRIAVGRGPLFESPWLLCHNRRAWWPIASLAFPRSLWLPFLIRGCSLFSATPFPIPPSTSAEMLEPRPSHRLSSHTLSFIGHLENSFALVDNRGSLCAKNIHRVERSSLRASRPRYKRREQWETRKRSLLIEILLSS